MTFKSRKRKISYIIFQRCKKQFPVPLHAYPSSSLVTALVSFPWLWQTTRTGFRGGSVDLCWGSASWRSWAGGKPLTWAQWAEGPAQALSPQASQWPTASLAHLLEVPPVVLLWEQSLQHGDFGDTLPLMQNFLWPHEKPNSAAEAHV